MTTVSSSDKTFLGEEGIFFCANMSKNLLSQLQLQVLYPDNFILVVSFTFLSPIVHIFLFPIFPIVHGGGNNIPYITLVTSFTTELEVQNGCNIVQV